MGTALAIGTRPKSKAPKSESDFKIPLKTKRPGEKKLLLELHRALNDHEQLSWTVGGIINELRDRYGWYTRELAPYFNRSRSRLDEFAATARAYPDGIKNPSLSFEAHMVARKAAKNVARGLTEELGRHVAPDYGAAIKCESINRGGKKDVRNTTKELMRSKRARLEPARLSAVAKLSTSNTSLIAKMIHGDAASTIAELADRSAKMIHLDPPYTNYKKTANGKLLGDCSTDANDCDNDTTERALPVTIAAIRAAAPKLVRNGVIALWQSGYPLSWEIAKAIEDAGLVGFPPVIWDKIVPQMGNPQVVAKTSVEICYIICRDGEKPLNFLEEDGVGQVITLGKVMKSAADFNVVHQMQKPEKINEELLRRLTEPGDMVVDAFGCSGSMCIAADRMDRRWVYSESNARNHALGVRNMQDHLLKKQVSA